MQDNVAFNAILKINLIQISHYSTYSAESPSQ